MTEYMNQPSKCIACMKGRQKVENTNMKVNGSSPLVWVPLIKHHVRYDPEMVAYVHFQCHMDIHEGLYPHLIQYQEGESKEYYNNKNGK